MLLLFGEYECKIDEKGRFSFPASLLKQLPQDMRKEFVIGKGLEKCLVIYPMNVWYEELQKIYKKNQHNPKNQAYARMFQQGASPVKLDKQKRILIPKKLAPYANIKKELVLIGMGNKIEIWDKETYEKWAEEQSLKELAESVMANEDEN